MLLKKLYIKLIFLIFFPNINTRKHSQSNSEVNLILLFLSKTISFFYIVFRVDLIEF